MQAEAQEEASRLDECLSALTTRRSQMEEALSEFEAAKRESELGGEGSTRNDRRTERKVDQGGSSARRASG